MTPRRRQMRSSERGIALVTTVWIALFLALTAATIATAARMDGGARRNAADLLAAREVALAGLHLAIHELSLVPADRSLPRDGRPVGLRLGDRQITVAIEDERGKIDLRFALPQHREALLRRLAAGAGIDAFDAVNMAQQIARELEVKPGEPPSSRLHSIAALGNMPGYSPELVRLLERHATLFGFGGEINPMTASREALSVIDGIDPRLIDAIIAARETGRPRPAVGRAEGSLTTIEGPVYTVRSTGRLANGIEATMTALVASEGIGIASTVARITILELR